MKTAVNKLFREDPYLAEVNTVVTGVDKQVVTVRDTIAYAFSGGQQSDDGSINGYIILKAEKWGNEINYSLDGEHHLKAGDPVLVKIDWEKRYKIMRLHFAAEIILELVNRNFNHPEKIGANITSEKARIDFLWERNISEMFPLLEEKAKELIAANKPIKSEFSDRERQRRYWEIDGFGKVACGGTHIRTTGEVGNFRLRRERQGKNKERIEIYLL
jgi:Ser-tRNA(Ala) deacylase AlaX